MLVQLDTSCNKNPTSEIALPLAYFLTFTCYGTWLHGAKETSVDRLHNKLNTDYVPRKIVREMGVKARMVEAPYLLDEVRRNIVLNAIKEVCMYRDWGLFAAHVRTNHVHVVVHALVKPEVVLNTLKVYASRHLTNASLDNTKTKRWTRHGSTRYLWHGGEVEVSVDYVVREQGLPMAVFEDIDALSKLKHEV